jgi:sulfotransferase family protein
VSSLIEGVPTPSWQRFRRRIRGRAWPTDIGPPAPPVCPPGWEVAPPDFVGIGVQRAGTSWWFDLLVKHPQVESPNGRRKELHYFDEYWRKQFDEGARLDYRSYFPRPPGHVAGEWTPRYVHDGWTPPLLAEAAPQAKILIILRDPIDRYLSGLTFALSRGATLNPVVASDAFTRGLYTEQLKRVARHFDKAQLLVLQFERCVEAPQEQLSRTFAFLGVDDQKVAPSATRVNASYRRKPDLRQLEIDRLVQGYEDDVLALARDFPEIDLQLWSHFRHLGSAVAGSRRAGSSP